MDSNPLVSICIPCYNGGKYIKEAISSIAGQTYSNIEIIIVDDGSEDDSVTVISDLLVNCPLAIKLIKQGNNGQCNAANVAFKSATGSFIKFFDADDVINPEHIEIQLRAIGTSEDYIAAGQVKRFYDNDIKNSLEERLANWATTKPIDWLLVDNGKGLGMMQCGMFLIPRSLLEKSGLWNEELSLINDFEFFPRLLLNAEQVIFTEQAQVFYRSGSPTTLSAILSIDRLKSAFTALQLTTNKILSIENSQRSRKVLANYWSLWAYHFYPRGKEFFIYANKEIFKLTGNDFEPELSGLSRKASFFFGWKLTKRIKTLKQKLFNP